MANRAYLVGDDVGGTTGPSNTAPTYDADAQVLAAATRIIPVLWLSLFDEEDLTHHVLENHHIPTLLASMDDGRTHLKNRRAQLADAFPNNIPQISAFEQLVEHVRFEFVKVDASEIWSLDPESLETQLTHALGWFSTGRDDDFQCLLDLAEIDYDFATKAFSVEHLPKHKFHGYAWGRELPWDDTEVDSESVPTMPQDLQFGTLARRGIEKHPFVTRLVEIDYFSRAGEKVNFPWAASKGNNLTDAYLTHAHDTDWAFVKLSYWNTVLQWISDNVQCDAKLFYRDQKDDIDTACHAIFQAKIMPRLPSSLRQYEIAFDLYFVWDLMHITIERELVAKGMPPGLCSLLLETYESGHLPCGWEENLPTGKLIIH